MRFVDTNILLYLISRAPAEREKAARAKNILGGDAIGLSAQVLQEFYVQATRSSRPDPITNEQAEGLVHSFLRFPVQETTVAIVQSAVQTSRRYQLSYWDAAILEAARTLGCDVVLSEDMGHGQDFGGVRVENPFL